MFQVEESPSEPAKERPRLHLQPRTKPIEHVEVPSDSPSSIDQAPPNNSDENQHNDVDVELVAPSRGAGSSIFGGAKPVDTTARELEIEKKMKDLQVTNEVPQQQEEEEEKVQTPK